MHTGMGAHRVTGRDDVAVAVQALKAGTAIRVEGMQEAPLLVNEDVPLGHKVSLRHIEAGEEVIKYGSSIGRASCGIPQGSHVHTHNLEGIRGRGDR